jgi:hypothetical protein
MMYGTIMAAVSERCLYVGFEALIAEGEVNGTEVGLRRALVSKGKRYHS